MPPADTTVEQDPQHLLPAPDEETASLGATARTGDRTGDRSGPDRGRPAPPAGDPRPG